jgi:hypothetical protein
LTNLGLLSQEILTKNLCCGLVLSRNLDKNPFIAKKPSVSQGLPVRKKTLITATFISVLLFSAAAGAFFVKSTQANPYRRYFEFKEVPPPAGAQPPVIIIHTPQNGSFYPKNFNLTFDVNISETNGDKSISSVKELYYKGSWDPDEIAVTQRGFGGNASFSIDLSGIPGGNHSLTIYAVGYGSYEVSHEFIDSITIFYNYEKFEMIGFSTVHFTKDLVSPRISFLSPPNGTYVTSDVELDFTVSEAASEIRYCLDGKENQTMTGSVTLTGLAEGAHNVTLYAADLAGNAAAPKTLFFSVDLPESFPIMPVTASIATVAIVSFGLGLLVYLKKRKR